MSLQELKRDLTDYAAHLPEIEVNGKKTRRYEDYDITVLADNYCKALDTNNARKKNIYSSALLLRFWYRIQKEYEMCKTSGVEREEIVYRILNNINSACKDRVWQDPEKHTNAQACINQIISSRTGRAIMYESNLQKNKKAPTISLDTPLDKEDPDSDTLIDQISVLNNNEEADEKTVSMIQRIIDNNKLVEAIILDNIAFKDVYKHETTTIKEIDVYTGKETKRTETTESFWPFKLVKELNNLGEEYVDYFARTYAVELEHLQVAFDAVKKASNSNKYKMIDRSKLTAKEILRLS